MTLCKRLIRVPKSGGVALVGVSISLSACTSTITDQNSNDDARSSGGSATTNNAGAAGSTGGAEANPARGGATGSSGATSDSSGSSSSAGANGSDVPISVSGSPIAESAGPLVMRRLTYREYDHMLAVLLGDTTAPASGSNRWTADATAETGFVAPNSIASYHAIQFNQAADTLVDAAIAALGAGKSTGKFKLPAGCSAPAATNENSCATNFIKTFGLSAYRRPVTAEEQKDLLTLFTTVRTDDAFSFVEAIGAIAKAMLQSPNFLYHWELGPAKPSRGGDGLVALSPWQVGARLATVLWESMPDDALLDAAQQGQLSTPEQISAQVERMLADPQAAQSLYSFHVQWLFNIGFHVTDLATVPSKPGSLLTDAAARGLQSEFTQYVSSVYAPPGDGTLSTLYTAPYAFVNKDLAAIYGVSGPATGFAKVNLDPTQRAGIFTQAAFLAGIEDTVADNPIYRGLAIYTKALCGTISPPPANVPPVTFVSGGTTRQSFDAHGSAACASGCHSRFDPPGFAFENYDGVGRYRTTDAGQSVDASGSFDSPFKSSGMAGGTTFQFKNAVDLVKALAASSEAQVCIDRQWARYMLGRMETTADIGSVQQAFVAGAAKPGFSLRAMVEALLSSKAFLYRSPSEGEAL